MKKEESTRKMKAIKIPRKGSQTPDLLTQALAGGYQIRRPSLLLLLQGLARSGLSLPRPTEKVKGLTAVRSTYKHPDTIYWLGQAS